MPAGKRLGRRHSASTRRGREPAAGREWHLPAGKERLEQRDPNRQHSHGARYQSLLVFTKKIKFSFSLASGESCAYATSVPAPSSSALIILRLRATVPSVVGILPGVSLGFLPGGVAGSTPAERASGPQEKGYFSHTET